MKTKGDVSHIKSGYRKILEYSFIYNFWQLITGSESAKRKIIHTQVRPFFHAKFLDIGCGTGELTRLWSKERPDLKFTLVNNHEWQLSLCDGETVLADMHQTGINRQFDVVMVNGGKETGIAR